jgi:hypothetical protein
MTSPRRLALAAALFAAVLLPACGSSNVVVGPGSRASLVVTVDPNPVIASQNTIGSSSASYKITITETNGLGGEFEFINGSVFDPTTGALVALNYYDSSDLQVFVGTKRIEALGTLSFTQTASYTLPSLAKAATLTVTTQLKDDKGSLVQASLLVNIQ